MNDLASYQKLMEDERDISLVTISVKKGENAKIKKELMTFLDNEIGPFGAEEVHEQYADAFIKFLKESVDRKF